METKTLQAEVRQEGGKGPARRLRRVGRIPAVFYGPGVEPLSLVVSPKELLGVLAGERGRNSVMKLNLGQGREELAMVRALDVHPVSRAIRHADFYRVSKDRPVTVSVPFRVEGRSLGQQKGGVANISSHSLTIRCTPDRIPVSIVTDITHLDMHQVLAVRDLQLPEGVEVLAPPKLTLVSVTEARRITEEEETGAAAAGAVPAEGAAAAPAPAEEKK